MSGDLEHQFLKFNVSDAEDCGITLPAETTREAEEECSKSVVIKVLSDKAVKFPGLQNVLRIIWDFTNAFKIKSLGSNKYHIFFNCMEDLDRVLVGCPWFFENFLIVVKQWRRGIADDARAFQWGPVWIQLWDLPPEWSTKAAAEYVCKSFGRVISVRNPSMDSMQKSYIRCLVEIDLSKPILIGAFVQQDGRKIWSNFKYENLAYFCFYCGVIGHAAKTCYTKFLDLQHGIDKEDQYGLWLKASNLKEKAPKERIVIEDPSPEQPPSPGQGNAEIRKMTNYSHGQSCRDTMHVEKAYEISIPEIFLRLFQRSNLNWRPHLETLSDLTIAPGAPLVLDWTGNGGINPNPLENPRISEVDISIEAGATSVGGQNSNVFGGLGEVNDTNTTQAEEIRTEGSWKLFLLRA